ncbi:MAG: DUF4340 domain-containing protein [Gemmatimonadetes bacterium]|nr:DUF4340 domain-containing protein [Gemmatimonadota bacterium]
MRSVVAHGVLLTAVLLVAFVTWTAEDRPASDDAAVVVWDRAQGDVARVSYSALNRLVELERRGAGDDAHIWGKETLTLAPPPADTARADSIARSAAAAATVGRSATPPDSGVTRDTAAARVNQAPAKTTQVEEYPVGEQGEDLLERLDKLRAVRDLGAVTDAKRSAYGLAEAEPKLTIYFRNGEQRTFTLGKNVVGGGDRYALDVDRNRVYVLPIALLQSLEGGSSMLRLMKYQPFEPNQVASVTLRAGNAERSVHRRTVGSPPTPIWTRAGSTTPDPAYGNFMEQLDRLWVSRYATNVAPDTLQLILRASYLNEDGRALGFLELLRTRAANDASPLYFMRTSRTIVLGEVYGPLAERVEQDIATLFQPSAGGAGP